MTSLPPVYLATTTKTYIHQDLFWGPGGQPLLPTGATAWPTVIPVLKPTPTQREMVELGIWPRTQGNVQFYRLFVAQS